MTTCVERLKKWFDENGVRYEVQHHREVFTSQAVATVLHEKGAHVAKVVIAWADERFVMLVLPAPAHVDFRRLQGLWGAARVRRAQEDEFKFLFPDCDLGAMPPFGNLYHLPVYLDQSLAAKPDLTFQAGSHRETMKIAMSDYQRLAAPIVGDFAVRRATFADDYAQEVRS